MVVIRFILVKYIWIVYEILLVLHDFIMNLNNVVIFGSWSNLCPQFYVVLTNIWQNINKWPYWKFCLPWFSYDCQKCTFVDPLNEYISPPNCVHYWVWSTLNIVFTIMYETHSNYWHKFWYILYSSISMMTISSWIIEILDEKITKWQ